MTPHWTDCQSELHDWLQHSDRLLIGCDFDGTLSPLVNRAEDATLLPEAADALRRLHELPNITVAVVSGRKLDDIRERIGIDGVLYGGNHGLEMLGPQGLMLAPGAETGLAQIAAALDDLRESINGVPGAWIEDKQFTASVHYRLAEKDLHPRVEELVRKAVDHRPELVIRQGKCIWEIRPALDWHKGSALTWMLEECDLADKQAMFIGDDLTDYDAFKSIAKGWPVIVGDTSPAFAKVRVNDPADTSAMLSWLADARGNR